MTEAKRKHLLDVFSRVKSWEDWFAFVEREFSLSEWASESEDEIAKLLDRSSFDYDGVIWHPMASQYAVDWELLDLHDFLSNRIFAFLDPEGAAENESCPDEFGLRCWRCLIWASECVAPQNLRRGFRPGNSGEIFWGSRTGVRL